MRRTSRRHDDLPPQDSAAMPLEAEARAAKQRWHPSLGLFWRTFFLLAVLLIGSILAWLQTLRALEFEPRAVQTAQQIAALVNLSRTALIHADAINRVSLIKTMTEQESLRIFPREPGDRFEPFNGDALGQRIALDLVQRLGPDTLVANSVNTEPGFWVGFSIGQDRYWLQTNKARFNRTTGSTWLMWLLMATVLSLVGAAVIARLINQPLKQLSFAANRVRNGDFEASTLDETVATREVRGVNQGFNRMTRQLAQIEQDRAVMLAGISHDLRTPLARLRLETELSVSDTQARADMAADIAQLDAIIDKFLDYARPGRAGLEPVKLRQVMESCVNSLQKRSPMQVNIELDEDLAVQADAVELSRVITNLLENAQRYGRSPDTGQARLDMLANAHDNWVRIRVRDYGTGVSPEQLERLTTAFYRGEAARTAANGAGLGLAIVDKSISRMGGGFSLRNSSTGGLVALITLKRSRSA